MKLKRIRADSSRMKEGFFLHVDRTDTNVRCRLSSSKVTKQGDQKFTHLSVIDTLDTIRPFTLLPLFPIYTPTVAFSSALACTSGGSTHTPSSFRSVTNSSTPLSSGTVRISLLPLYKEIFPGVFPT